MKKNKMIAFRLEEDIALKFKVLCAQLQKSQNEIIENFIKEFIKKKEAH